MQNLNQAPRKSVVKKRAVSQARNTPLRTVTIVLHTEDGRRFTAATFTAETFEQIKAAVECKGFTFEQFFLASVEEFLAKMEKEGRGS